jgi:hypothetical protein
MIDKIVKQKAAPKNKNVLWEDGTNLKINRNGIWENVVSGGGSNLENRIARLEQIIEEITTNK